MVIFLLTDQTAQGSHLHVEQIDLQALRQQPGDRRNVTRTFCSEFQ